ncbi:class A beta-lactamase [Rhodovulum visakhapatnamense]|uniref:Beta-lactamase n=1 Tax=Rhodovulum visakhapatnamense TaxID=364297 RepID=A0A4R8G8Y2_9RHOB|nr:class A beta-lactamase [Rhodovulum visakhapatnamense]TDX31926.1 beta-lactamase class A [Rhodovulum visakhapatnamense]
MSHALRLPRLLAGLALGLALSSPALARTAEDDAAQALADTISRLESALPARIGVAIRDSGSDWGWGHRDSERFLMASTFKSVLCAAVLDRADRGLLSLGDAVAIPPEAILDYAPVAETHVGGTMTLGDLCLATLDMSDNTAANLLIARLGGPQEVTAFLRRIGDPVTRLDRTEPDLNLLDPADPRDTTSPAAMAATWQRLLLGDVLSPASRARLADWMSHGSVTASLIRASAPPGWTVSDKSGGGREYTRNLVAMIRAPGRAPVVVAIYLSDCPADWATRNAAVAEIGAAVIALLKTR